MGSLESYLDSILKKKRIDKTYDVKPLVSYEQKAFLERRAGKRGMSITQYSTLLYLNHVNYNVDVSRYLPPTDKLSVHLHLDKKHADMLVDYKVDNRTSKVAAATQLFQYCLEKEGCRVKKS